MVLQLGSKASPYSHCRPCDAQGAPAVGVATGHVLWHAGPPYAVMASASLDASETDAASLDELHAPASPPSAATPIATAVAASARDGNELQTRDVLELDMARARAWRAPREDRTLERAVRFCPRALLRPRVSE